MNIFLYILKRTLIRINTCQFYIYATNDPNNWRTFSLIDSKISNDQLALHINIKTETFNEAHHKNVTCLRIPAVQF